MDNKNAEDIQNDICDEDVVAAIRESKFDLNLSAEALKKIYSLARRHARARVASRMHVQDVMTRDVLAVNKFDDINHAVNILSGKNVSGLPVVDRENRVVGIISEADIVSMVAISEKKSKRRGRTFRNLLDGLFGGHVLERKMGDIVGDVMTSPAITIYPDAEISEAVRIMDQYRIRRLPVVDGGQKLLGLISRSDIVRTMGEKLGQIDSGDQAQKQH